MASPFPRAPGRPPGPSSLVASLAAEAHFTLWSPLPTAPRRRPPHHFPPHTKPSLSHWHGAPGSPRARRPSLSESEAPSRRVEPAESAGAGSEALLRVRVEPALFISWPFQAPRASPLLDSEPAISVTSPRRRAGPRAGPIRTRPVSTIILKDFIILFQALIKFDVQTSQGIGVPQDKIRLVKVSRQI